MKKSAVLRLIKSCVSILVLTLVGTTESGAKGLLTIPDTLTSGNPIITHIRSADPAAEVWNDGRVWIYASHDPNDAVDYSTMEDYRAYSSNDLVHWTDHGTILHARDVSWGNSANAWMFAPDAAFKNDTYYLYFPTLSSDWQWRVGVATSDKPEGPFTDIGRYIEGPDHIDPACFMDDDGQAYLLWGGGGDGEGGGSGPWIARLKENMTELAETPRRIEYGADNFGEGGYMHKRDSIYYFSWTCNTCWPYQGYYGMADNPYGPFEYKGEMKRIPPGAQDHHSMIEFHGQWYYFYHVGNYGPGGSAYRRNICIDSMFYRPDGTIQEVIGTTTGVAMDLVGREHGHWIPGRVEAEDYFRKNGNLATVEADTITRISGIRDGDQLEYVLNIPGSEMYEMALQINDPFPGTSVRISIDDTPADTLWLEQTSLQPQDSIFLHSGKHLVKLMFDHPDSTADLLELDFFEINSPTEYHAVLVTSTGGGTVSPEGTSWYANGDSAEIRIKPDDHFVLEEVRIDGNPQPLLLRHVIRNIQKNHSVEVKFAACREIAYTPGFQVNNNPVVNGTEIGASEGDTVMIRLDMEESHLVAWSGPNGYTNDQPEISLQGVRVGQSGIYSAIVENQQGCTVEIIFNLNVAYAELDVYEAEDFFSQGGIQLQHSTDLGGGWFLGAIEHNDWSYYRIEVDKAGIYDLTARVATATAGGTIEIGSADSILAEIAVTGTLSGGWQEWYTTSPVEIPLDSGVHRLKFTFRGGSGYLFNFNWFNLEYNRPFETDTTATALHSLALPRQLVISGPHLQFELPSASIVEMKLISMHGAVLGQLIPPGRRPAGKYSLHLDEAFPGLENLADGLYLVWFRCNDKVYVEKFLRL